MSAEGAKWDVENAPKCTRLTVSLPTILLGGFSLVMMMMFRSDHSNDPHLAPSHAWGNQAGWNKVQCVFICLCVGVCLCLYRSVCLCSSLSLSISVSVFVFVFIDLCVCVCVCLYRSVCLCLCLSWPICVSVFVFVSIDLCVCVCLYLSVCLCLCLLAFSVSVSLFVFIDLCVRVYACLYLPVFVYIDLCVCVCTCLYLYVCQCLSSTHSSAKIQYSESLLRTNFDDSIWSGFRLDDGFPSVDFLGSGLHCHCSSLWRGHTANFGTHISLLGELTKLYLIRIIMFLLIWYLKDNFRWRKFTANTFWTKAWNNDTSPGSEVLFYQ